MMAGVDKKRTELSIPWASKSVKTRIVGVSEDVRTSFLGRRAKVGKCGGVGGGGGG